MNSYRSFTSRRDSDRSSEHTGDRYRDRDRGERERDRDRDRDERPRNRDSNDRHPPPHDREIFPPPRRTQSEQIRAPIDPPKMSSEQAVAEIAQLHRQLYDVLVDKVKSSSKKDLELRGFKKREADLKGRGSQYSSVRDVLRDHQNLYKKHEAEFDKEIAKADSRLKELSENYGSLLIKHLPIAEIKTRQLIDDVKVELASELKSAPDNRFQKLEQQFASLQDGQKSQAADLSNLKKENGELRAQHAQLQRVLESKATQDQEIETLKQAKDNLGSQVSELKTQVAALVKQIESQQADFTTSLQRKEAQPAPDVADATLRQDLKSLEQRVIEHDNQLSSFDATEYTEAMDKLLGYPCWMDLDARISRQQTELQSLNDEVQGVKNSVADAKELQDVKDSIAGIKEEHEKLSVGFTTGIVNKVSELVRAAQTKANLVEGRVKALEDRKAAATPTATSVAAGAVSPQPSSSAVNLNGSVAELVATKRVEAVEFAIKAHQNELNNLRSNLTAMRNDVNGLSTSARANDLMIKSLDHQFKNMTTTEMAQIILENIIRLPPARVSLDMQNFHERLGALEAFRQTQTKRGIDLQKWGMALAERLETPNKRSLTDEETLEPQQKRQRLGGVSGAANGVGGAANGVGGAANGVGGAANGVGGATNGVGVAQHR